LLPGFTRSGTAAVPQRATDATVIPIIGAISIGCNRGACDGYIGISRFGILSPLIA